MLTPESSLRHVAVYGSYNRKSMRWELALNENNPNDKEALHSACLHPPKHRFTRYDPFSKVTLGDWDVDIAKIDFDESLMLSLPQVKRLSMLMNNRYGLDGFIILESSVTTHKVRNEDLSKIAFQYKTKSYHVVFNRKVSHDELNSILAWLCLFTKDNKLITWFLLQMIKGTYTLRHGFKKRKHSPRIVFCYGNQDKQIKRFLANRCFIHKFLGVTK